MPGSWRIGNFCLETRYLDALLTLNAWKSESHQGGGGGLNSPTLLLFSGDVIMIHLKAQQC